jgi:hypothetical protein
MKLSFFAALVFISLIFGFAWALAGGAAQADIRYNAKVPYREGAALAFPDFSLVYKGTTKAAPPKGLHAWSIYQFVVTAKGGEQKISWSAGTGDIGPTSFQVGNRHFLLELSRSDALGKLNEGELVVREAGAK